MLIVYQNIFTRNLFLMILSRSMIFKNDINIDYCENIYRTKMKKETDIQCIESGKPRSLASEALQNDQLKKRK